MLDLDSLLDQEGTKQIDRLLLLLLGGDFLFEIELEPAPSPQSGTRGVVLDMCELDRIAANIDAEDILRPDKDRGQKALGIRYGKLPEANRHKFLSALKKRRIPPKGRDDRRFFAYERRTTRQL